MRDKIDVVVDSRIRMQTRDLGDELALDLRESFTHQNPQREMLRRIGKPYWAEPKTIATWAEHEGELSLPRGGMGRLREAFTRQGRGRVVHDRRVQGSPAGIEMPDHRLELWPFQHDAVQSCIVREGGLVRAPTGAGKTCIGFALAAELKVTTLIVVYNAGLFDQWVKRAQRELGIRSEDVGIIRGSTCTLKPFTVAMQQTLNARGISDRMRQYFGQVIVDEVHRAAAKTMYAAVDPWPARYRFGISADARRKDRKEFITYDLFGDVIYDIPRKDLIKAGHVLDVQIRVIPTEARAPWYGMPSEGQPELEVDTVRLQRELSEDHARNEQILSIVLDEAEREQVLVLSHLRDHCLVLDQRLVGYGVRTGFLIGGEDYRVEFRKSVEGVERGDIRVGVGTFQAIGQGLDLPGVSVGVCATPIASNQQVFGQVRGRFCRTQAGKVSARMYYPWDQHVFGLKHLQNIVSWNANVVVLVDGQWAEGRQYLKQAKENADAKAK